MRLELKQWLPDQSPLDSPGAEEIKNVYPVARGYKPIPAMVEISTNALAGVAKGYYSAHAADGATLTFAADDSHLYSYSVTTFTNIDRTTGGVYTAQDTDLYWQMEQFGNRVIAVTYENSPQYYDLTISTNFENLAGSPPRARYIGIVRDFVVLGFTINSASEVYWSSVGDSTAWTVGVNECDSQTLQSGGRISGIIGGEVGYIIQERQVVKMTYVGSPVIFQFDVLDQGYGCVAPYSIVRVQRMAFYKGSDGFYMLDLATGSGKAIGSEKVDRWFKENASGGYMKQMRGAVDTTRKLVWWSFISTATSGTTPDHVIGYNWELDRWFHAAFDHELLTSAFTEAITLDEIDASFPDIDLCPISLDSDYWLGGLNQLRGVSTNHKLTVFEGDNLAAVIQSQEGEPVPGRRSMITNTRPLVDTSESTIIVKSRERLADSVSSTTNGIMETNGDISIMSSGRYHRAEIRIPAGTDWTYVQGVDFDAVDDGAI